MNNLNVKAKHSYDALKKSIQWASESKNLEISENQRLIKNLKYSLYKIKNLQNAANSRACIGAYGASQAGKSYMVSTLARKKNTKLIANMGPFSVDFLEHINPPGGQESTGLVTRFTIQKYESPEGFPIKVKLLSEIDLVKILFNSYAFDILSSEDEDIEIHKKNVENLLLEFDEFSLNSESPIQLEDVFGLEDYCNSSQFSSNFRVQALKKTRYWSRLTELLPILPLNLRIKIYGALWENLDIYSGILNKLLNEINSLGNPEVVYCSPETLFTNTNGIFARSKLSIINVSALDGQLDRLTGIANTHGLQSLDISSSAFVVFWVASTLLSFMFSVRLLRSSQKWSNEDRAALSTQQSNRVARKAAIKKPKSSIDLWDDQRQ
jgi:hypothetical protein